MSTLRRSPAILLTLAVRPVGALIFGRAAEKFGRKPILMLNIVFFSAFELLSAAAPSLMLFFLLRVLYGVAMGGSGAWPLRWRWRRSPTARAA